jgi:hypothetical protein
MPIVRRSDCVPLPIVVCPVVAVHASCHPTLQHHNSYNRTDNYRQWNAVGSPDDGHKDAWNMLRYYWLPINRYLLHLVGFSFTYLIYMFICVCKNKIAYSCMQNCINMYIKARITQEHYEVCPESNQPFWISRELVGWPWCNLAASQRRP